MGVKLRTSIIVVLALTAVKLKSVSGQGSCGASFNQTKGEITTDGFPYRLGFNHTCSFIIEGGRVKLTFQNVSLPTGTVVLVADLKTFIAGTHKLQSRVIYTADSRTVIYVVVRANDTLGFNGVRILYERISNELCHYSYRANANREMVYSPRWHRNVRPNTTCEYHIYTGSSSSNQVVQISIAELSLLPGDYLTIYDEEDDRILARYNGTPKFIKSMTSNSTSVRVVFRSSDKPTSGRRRFSLSYRNVGKGSCLEEYYGESGQSSSVNKSCVFVIRVPNGRVLLRFDNLFIPPGDNIVVTQRYFDSVTEKSYLTPTDSGHVKYIVALWRKVEIEINFNSSTRFDFSFKDTKKNKRHKSDKCPFYLEANSFEYSVQNPGYPGNYPGPSTCEYFIQSSDNNQVVHVIFSELFLSPGDNLTIYDGGDGALLAMYDGTPGLLKAVTSNSASVRVVLRIKDLKPSTKRRFHLYYRTISKGSCVEEYFGKSGSLSSTNKSCVFIIRVPYSAVELRFASLFIPLNERITVTKRSRTKFAQLMPADSGRVKYIIINYARLVPIHVKFNSPAKFNLTFKEFKQRYSVNLQGSSGDLTSPYYSQIPHFPQTYLSDFFVTYHVHVPAGHVKLNFTDLTLSRGRWPYPGDSLTIYDGNDSSAQELARYTNRTINDLTHLIVSSKNFLTVEYSASSNFHSSGNSFRQFKAVYTMETQVKYCTSLNFPNSYTSRNLTLPGWKTTYKCHKGYVNKAYPYGSTSEKSVERLCVYNGNWAPAKPLNCLLRCEPPSVPSNSSLEWLVFGASKNLIHVGISVEFYCNWDEDMIGQNVITCTSFGNYSASPPICKKRPPRDKYDSGVKPWVYGAGFGGAAFIISIVLAILRVCFGCFGCCASQPLCSASDSSADETTELGKLRDPEQI